MKYSRMLFPPKNNSFLVNILPLIKHSVKNKENVRFPGFSENKDGRTSPSGESAKLTSVIETGSKVKSFDLRVKGVDTEIDPENGYNQLPASPAGTQDRV